MKVIDILNKIANGENVRFRIIEESGIYHWNKSEYMVFENTGNEEQWYIDDKWLNKEVEIIEEDKKIEKLDTYVDRIPIQCDDIEEVKEAVNKCLLILETKINEIIDYINKENK